MWCPFTNSSLQISIFQIHQNFNISSFHLSFKKKTSLLKLPKNHPKIYTNPKNIGYCFKLIEGFCVAWNVNEILAERQRENNLEVKVISNIWVLKVSLTRAYCLFVCFVILQTQDFVDWEVGQLPWRNAWCQGRWELTWLSWMCRINEGSNWIKVKTLHHSWTDKLVTVNKYSAKLIYWMKKPCNLSLYIRNSRSAAEN